MSDLIKDALTGRIIDVVSSGKWNPEHADAPAIIELVELRELIQGTELLCLHWLRNRFVQLRKQGKLTRKEHYGSE